MAGISVRVFLHCRYTRARAKAQDRASARESVDPDQGSPATKTRWEYDSTKNTASPGSAIAHQGNTSGYL